VILGRRAGKITFHYILRTGQCQGFQVFSVLIPPCRVGRHGLRRMVGDFILRPAELFMSFAPSVFAEDAAVIADALALCDRLDQISLAPTRDAREEAAWLARARAGEDAAFRWLLTRYRLRTLRLAGHVLRSGEADAEDVVQEAFVRAFRAVPSLRGDAFFPFLCRITVRVCADRQRRAGWGREMPLADWDAPALPPHSDMRLLVEAMLDRLSPPLRAALVLREMDGMDYDDIARVLQVPVGTVRSRLSAARAQFRQWWTAAQEETDNV